MKDGSPLRSDRWTGIEGSFDLHRRLLAENIISVGSIGKANHASLIDEQRRSLFSTSDPPLTNSIRSINIYLELIREELHWLTSDSDVVLNLTLGQMENRDVRQSSTNRGDIYLGQPSFVFSLLKMNRKGKFDWKAIFKSFSISLGDAFRLVDRQQQQ